MKIYNTIRGAQLSDCEKYRFALWRNWDTSKSEVNFIMLNPSKADHEQDDNTIRRCVQFAKNMNMGGIVVTNLFAYRATKPADLLKAGVLAIQPEVKDGVTNNETIMHYANKSNVVIVAWGTHGNFLMRDFEIIGLLKSMLPNNKTVYCFNKNLDGSPMHPLFVPYTHPQQLMEFYI